MGQDKNNDREPAMRFEQLEVWRESHALTLEIYRVTMRLPDTERYGLVSQMRRAAVSVPANIVEGFKRRGRRDKIHFYNIAQGSLEEVRYYTLLCRDLGFQIDYEEFQTHTLRIGRMLQALINSIADRP